MSELTTKMQPSTQSVGRHEPRIAVVVTARNASSHLPCLLEALRLQTLSRRDFEFVLVDDASSDGTPDIGRTWPGSLVIESPTHVGLPRGRNIGIRACRAPIIAFTDADCVPDRDWLERGIERMEHDGADILAGGITIPIDHDDSTAAFVDSATYLDQERYARRGFGAGANLWVRRDVFERAGYFNEELEAYGGDEEDLCHRAVANGARLVYAPEAHVRHPPRRRLRDLMRKAYRLGYGLAAHRRHNAGPLGQHPRMFLQWRSYTPSRRIYNLDRARAQLPGRIGLRRLAAMYAVQHLCIQLPLAFGDLMGELHQIRAERRRVVETPAAERHAR